jgi:hypothetical protein
MAQLSRPYQIGLGAIVLLAAVWMLLLQGHSASTSSPASSASVAPAAPATTTNSVSKSSSSSSAKQSGSSAHSSAPGVAGLTRAIEKAHGAATTSDKTNQQLQEKSAQASSSGTSAAPATAAPAKVVTPSTTSTSTAAAAPASTTKSSAAPSVASRVNSPTKERVVEAQLAKGKIALILFWDPKGADDQEIHKAVGQLHAKNVAVNVSSAKEIASFGTITRGVQVFGTPTLLIVNKQGATIMLTGPQDAFAIDQAISEARHS